VAPRSLPTANTAGGAVGTQELAVCTNRTCKKQGSQQVLRFLQDISAGSGVSARESGCLGTCGSGPNILVSDKNKAVKIVSHVATYADAQQLLSQFCGVSVDSGLLQSTQLRLSANAAAIEGRLEDAIDIYSQALSLQAPNRHLLFSNRSAAFLQLKRAEEALLDAESALAIAPPTFHTAWVRVIDSLYALNQHAAAAERLQAALKLCPGFSGCPEYKAIRQALQEHIPA